MRFSSAWMPTTQFSVKDADASPTQAHAVQQRVDEHRLEHVQLKVPVGAADGDRHVVAHHLPQK